MRVFAHVPYHLLEQNLDLILSRRINPEIHFTGESLDNLLPEQLTAVAGVLSANGIRTTIHAPFIDLNPGSVETLVREATRHRFKQVLDAADILKPEVMVFHPGYDRWRYGDSQEKWLKHSIDSWQMVIERAESIDCTIAVENIFEEDPSTLRSLLEAVDSPRLRHCFDVGHWNLFGTTSLEEWFGELGAFIAETHVHDNFGKKDDHLPIGDGIIDFDLFFSLMDRHAPTAAFTIEAHCQKDVLTALERLKSRLPHTEA
ncbi:Sugar phosphate isomerase/epimerase [Geobacter sp. DSM 9736]|nr:Sugar phosphate isomerase/epimerase [Geobacter sp. DSM 9736]